jgi:hypothetical protein
MRTPVLIISTLAAVPALPGVAFGKTVNGDVGISNAYVDRDLFVLTDGPVGQASLNATVSDNCELSAGGTQGLNTRIGGELDLGASCDFKLTEKVSVNASVERELLRDQRDITVISGSVSVGPFDLEVKHYFWDGNPDASRAEVSYTLKPTKQVTVRPAVVYETGFGEKDIVVGIVDLSYDLDDHLSLNASVYTPLHKGAEDERTTRATIGVTYTF